MAFRVQDAARALRDAVAAGAKEVKGRWDRWSSTFRRSKGVGGSLIYLVDRQTGPSIYDIDFVMEADAEPSPRGAGLKRSTT
jgi:4-hydroxyphenylpyruvate dioxygenase